MAASQRRISRQFGPAVRSGFPSNYFLVAQNSILLRGVERVMACTFNSVTHTADKPVV
jgi:hypothetical protein